MNCFSSPFQKEKKGRQRGLETALLSRGGELRDQTRGDGDCSCGSQNLIESQRPGAGLSGFCQPRHRFPVPVFRSQPRAGGRGGSLVGPRLRMCPGLLRKTPASSAVPPGSFAGCFSKCFLNALWLGGARLLLRLSQG